jgi:predicted kinase
LQVVFIFGPTASGKLTIAREVASLTGFRLFPDHLAVNLVKDVFDYGMRAFTRIREWAWIEVLREAVHANRSLVFTFKPQSAIRSSFISHACVIIERLGGEVVFVELTCPEETIEARIENEDRRTIGKLSSLAEYQRLRDQGAFQFRTMPTPAVKIDTSQCSPSEAAGRIVALLDP